MCYCPTCQTDGKLLKDRRLSTAQVAGPKSSGREGGERGEGRAGEEGEEAVRGLGRVRSGRAAAQRFFVEREGADGGGAAGALE